MDTMKDDGYIVRVIVVSMEAKKDTFHFDEGTTWFQEFSPI